jgi:hypothetical protein
VTALDIDRMNDERSKSVDRAQRAYADKWQPIYAAWRPILQRHATQSTLVTFRPVSTTRRDPWQ